MRGPAGGVCCQLHFIQRGLVKALSSNRSRRHGVLSLDISTSDGSFQARSVSILEQTIAPIWKIYVVKIIASPKSRAGSRDCALTKRRTKTAIAAIRKVLRADDCGSMMASAPHIQAVKRFVCGAAAASWAIGGLRALWEVGRLKLSSTDLS